MFWWFWLHPERLSICSFGIIKICTLSIGLMSLKANRSSSSYTIEEGISYSAILQKIQSVITIPIKIYLTLYCFFLQSRKFLPFALVHQQHQLRIGFFSREELGNETKGPLFHELTHYHYLTLQQ